MPAVDLSTCTAGGGSSLERAIVAVLTGVPVTPAAAAAGVSTAALTEAVHDYQTAGRAALDDRARDGRWHQVDITFTDWAQAEDIASTALWPHLRDAESRRLTSCWWYIRKVPSWRLRLRPTPHTATADLHQAVVGVLAELAAQRLIAGWSPGRYEPETLAFGGAMDVTHQLFHADSTHIFRYLHRCQELATPTPMGRRELSILLCTALLRGAGQEWHEQGDVWWRVARMRPQPDEDSLPRIPVLSRSVRRLLLLNTAATEVIGPTGPLAVSGTWISAMTTTGHALAASARTGQLRRGLRDVLAHQVLFHWNRLGLPTTTQALLAHSAVHAVMHATSD